MFGYRLSIRRLLKQTAAQNFVFKLKLRPNNKVLGRTKWLASLTLFDSTVSSTLFKYGELRTLVSMATAVKQWMQLKRPTVAQEWCGYRGYKTERFMIQR